MDFLHCHPNARLRSHVPADCQYGQSLTEFAVVLVVLVPLLLMVPLLGKYVDMSQAATQAGRYVAWEKTVDAGKDDAKLADEVRLRFFANLGKPIKTDSVPNDNADGERNAFWADHTGSRLLASFKDVKVATSAETPSSLAGVLSEAGSFFGLESANLYRGDVQVKIAKVGADTPLMEPLNKLELSVTRHNVILADAWNAGSPDAAVSRVKSGAAVPSNGLDNEVVDAAKTALSLVEPALAEFHPGYVKPDVVPKDRLPGYVPPAKNGGGFPWFNLGNLGW